MLLKVVETRKMNSNSSRNKRKTKKKNNNKNKNNKKNNHNKKYLKLLEKKRKNIFFKMENLMNNMIKYCLI